jgi:hypothetical protein
MVELGLDWFPRGLKFADVLHPSERLVKFPFDAHDHPVGMPVEPGAFVPGRHVRQSVGRLKGALSEDLVRRPRCYAPHAPAFAPERPPEDPCSHLPLAGLPKGIP